MPKFSYSRRTSRRGQSHSNKTWARPSSSYSWKRTTSASQNDQHNQTNAQETQITTNEQASHKSIAVKNDTTEEGATEVTVPKTMTRSGNHKLIVSQTTFEQRMKRIAPNKLVVRHKTSTTNDDNDHESSMRHLQSAKTGTKLAYSRRIPTPPRKMAPHQRHSRKRPGAQRIPIAVTDETQVASTQTNVSSNQTTTKLTDFAYRQSRGSASGLIRHAPNTSTTPVCPHFLRGVACTNPRCLKRHDVPKEYTVPICLFFQNKGMCLKQDCPFRHVKVNPKATVCPSFAVLGFCEDKNCIMRHVRENTNHHHHHKNNNNKTR